ncbi:MAG: peptidylprolyl isomerase [Marinilabiliaceae bacterium]|nr:peptidylprolyl isomerase [Marinilabiliaceae bacterium]
MKLKYIMLPLFGMFFGMNALMAQGNVIDEVIAIVGDKAMLRSDIEHQYQQSLMEGVNFSGDAKCKILEEQLIQKLMLNQAVLDSIEVGENEVVNEVDRRMNYFIQQIGDQKKLEEYFNKSMIQIKREQMEMVRNQMLTQRMQGDITKNIKVIPAEIRLFYRDANKDSLPMVGTQYEVQQISVYPEVEQKEIDRVKDQLRDFQKQIIEGRDFATLAVLYSEDPGSATRGGDLGWATRSTFVPEFATVAFNLQDKNKVSKIVETEYGFHIIQLLDRKGERINVRHILIKPKISSVARDNARLRLDSIGVLVKEKGMPFHEAALRFSMDKDTRANGGLMVNEYNNSSKFEITHLERMPELARELQKMKEGDVTAPVLTKDKNGKEVYQMYLLKKKTDPHRANLQDDYQVIQNALLARKREQTMKNWIREKQRSTYVSLDKAWMNCEFEYEGWGK